jgi:hypothetical protein
LEWERGGGLGFGAALGRGGAEREHGQVRVWTGVLRYYDIYQNSDIYIYILFNFLQFFYIHVILYTKMFLPMPKK